MGDDCDEDRPRFSHTLRQYARSSPLRAPDDSQMECGPGGDGSDGCDRSDRSDRSDGGGGDAAGAAGPAGGGDAAAIDASGWTNSQLLNLLSSGKEHGQHLPSVGSGTDMLPWLKAYDNKIHPCRLMAVNLSAAYLQPDAKSLLDALTPEDPVLNAHANGQFALLTLFSAGTSKGVPTGVIPSLTEEGEAEREKRNKTSPPYSTYTYKQWLHEDQAYSDEKRQFGFLLEYIRNKSQTGYWGVRVWKYVMDKMHSDSKLLQTVMEENQNAFNQTTNHAMPDRLRKTSEASFAKEARRMDDKCDLERSAANAYRWVRTNADMCKLFDLYSGTNNASPLYEQMYKRVNNAAMNIPISDTGTLANKHPLSFEIALNVRRDNGAALFAGMKSSEDAEEADPNQCNIDGYIGPDNSMVFPYPELVWFSSHASVRSLMSVPFPEPLTGSVKPPDDVLKFYFSRMYQTDMDLANAVDAQAVLDNGLDAEWRAYSELCERGFYRMIGGVSASSDMARLMESTMLVNNSSIDLSPEEKMRLKGASFMDNGKRPREAIVVVAKKIQRAFDFLNAFSVQKNEAIRRMKQQAVASDRIMAEQTRRDRTVASVFRGINVFGISLMSRIFLSRRERADVPPGILASHDALMSDLRAFGTVVNNGTGVYKMDTNDPRSAALGTANIAFGNGNDQYQDSAMGDGSPAAPKNAWSVWRAFISDMFSRILRIDGREVRICIEIYQQVFETLFGFSTCLVLPGGPGIGKSMRGLRMMELMPDGCFMRAGSRSEKEGLNREWNPYCGYARLYDEIPKSFSCKETEDMMKQIVSDNATQHSRSVKCTTMDGVEDFKTIQMYQIHSETHIIPNNEGPLLNRSDEEPSTSKQALYNRCTVQVCFGSSASHDDAHANENEYRQSINSPANASAIAAFRVMVGLIKKVLSYSVNLPPLCAKTEHANVLFALFDRMLVHEFGMQRPDNRRESKRHQTLQLIAAEAACAEVWFTKQSAVNFDFMMPQMVVNPDDPIPPNGVRGHLPLWDDQQIEPATRRAAMPTMHDILAAWSASLDYSEQTSAHFFWVLHLCAESVGVQADLRDMMIMNPGGPDPNTPLPASGDRPGLPRDEDLPDGSPEPPVYNPQYNRLNAPSFLGRNSGATVQDMEDRLLAMENQRIARVAGLRLGLRTGSKDMCGSVSANLDALWAHAAEKDLPFIFDVHLQKMRRMTREEASGYSFPNPFDLLAVGYHSEELGWWSVGLGTDCGPQKVDPKFGVRMEGWSLMQWQGSNKNPTAAAMDPAWRMIDDQSYGGGGEKTSEKVDKGEKRWHKQARSVMSRAPRGPIAEFGLTENIVRDVLHQISLWDVDTRCPRNAEFQNKFEDAMTKTDERGTIMEGSKTLSDTPTAGSWLRPANANAFLLDSRQKRAVFGDLQSRSRFRSYLPLDPDGNRTFPGTHITRLEALVDHGRLPALAPAYSTRVEKSSVLKMTGDNRLIFNTEYLMRFQALYAEVALANVLHEQMRGCVYHVKLGERMNSARTQQEGTPAGGIQSNLYAEQNDPERSDAARPKDYSTTPIPDVPLSWDALQVFLTTKALKKITYDADAVVRDMDLRDVVVPRFTTRFPSTSEGCLGLLTIPWSQRGTAEEEASSFKTPTKREIDQARESAKAACARSVRDDDPVVLQHLMQLQNAKRLPVSGNAASFSNWFGNCFVIGQEGGLWADASDPVFKSICESTMGITSHELSKRIITSDQWRNLLGIEVHVEDGDALSRLTKQTESIASRIIADQKHEMTRARQAVVGGRMDLELPPRVTLKRTRDEVCEEGGPD
mgnify:CR=1 FL=1